MSVVEVDTSILSSPPVQEGCAWSNLALGEPRNSVGPGCRSLADAMEMDSSVLPKVVVHQEFDFIALRESQCRPDEFVIYENCLSQARSDRIDKLCCNIDLEVYCRLRRLERRSIETLGVEVCAFETTWDNEVPKAHQKVKQPHPWTKLFLE